MITNVAHTDIVNNFNKTIGVLTYIAASTNNGFEYTTRETLHEDRITYEIDIDGGDKYELLDIDFNEDILNNITHISLKKMNLKSIPNVIYKMENLHSLKLISNKIKFIGDDIVNLKRLHLISLNNNNISKINPLISKLENINYLIFDNNPIRSIPKELSTIDTTYFKLNSRLTKIDPCFATWRSFNNLSLHISNKNWISLLIESPDVFNHENFPNVWPAKFDITDKQAKLFGDKILTYSSLLKTFIFGLMNYDQKKKFGHTANVKLTALKKDI